MDDKRTLLKSSVNRAGYYLCRTSINTLTSAASPSEITYELEKRHHRKIKNRLPIIQAPMLGVSTPEMAAEISNQGGLGSLPVGSLSPEATLHLIRKTANLTDKPFAVNLFAHKVPAYADNDIDPMRQFILQ